MSGSSTLRGHGISSRSETASATRRRVGNAMPSRRAKGPHISQACPRKHSQSDRQVTNILYTNDDLPPIIVINDCCHNIIQRVFF